MHSEAYGVLRFDYFAALYSIVSLCQDYSLDEQKLSFLPFWIPSMHKSHRMRDDHSLFTRR